MTFRRDIIILEAFLGNWCDTTGVCYQNFQVIDLKRLNGALLTSKMNTLVVDRPIRVFSSKMANKKSITFYWMTVGESSWSNRTKSYAFQKKCHKSYIDGNFYEKTFAHNRIKTRVRFSVRLPRKSCVPTDCITIGCASQKKLTHRLHFPVKSYPLGNILWKAYIWHRFLRVSVHIGHFSREKHN